MKNDTKEIKNMLLKQQTETISIQKEKAPTIVMSDCQVYLKGPYYITDRNVSYIDIKSIEGILLGYMRFAKKMRVITICVDCKFYSLYTVQKRNRILMRTFRYATYASRLLGVDMRECIVKTTRTIGSCMSNFMMNSVKSIITR